MWYHSKHYEGGRGTSEMSIRVLLSDDHRIVREGLRTLLDKEPDIEVVGEAEDGRSTL